MLLIWSYGLQSETFSEVHWSYIFLFNQTTQMLLWNRKDKLYSEKEIDKQLITYTVMFYWFICTQKTLHFLVLGVLILFFL